MSELLNIDKLPVGLFCKDELIDAWPQNAEKWMNRHAQVIENVETKSSKVLCVDYPEGSFGPATGGCQFVIKLPPAPEYTLTYRIKFSNDFDFKRGGKLPGLTSGGAKYTGGCRPTEGEGWSARYMWGENGAAQLYLYYIDMAGQYGDSLRFETPFNRETWHELKQSIKVNDPDEKNGMIEVWLDGVKVLSRSDLRLRIGNQALIDSFYFSTFHGGNDLSWATSRDCHAYFDGFILEEGAH